MQFRSLVFVGFLSLLALVVGCSRQPASPVGEDSVAATEEAPDTASSVVAETPESDDPATTLS